MIDDAYEKMIGTIRSCPWTGGGDSFPEDVELLPGAKQKLTVKNAGALNETDRDILESAVFSHFWPGNVSWTDGSLYSGSAGPFMEKVSTSGTRLSDFAFPGVVSPENDAGLSPGEMVAHSAFARNPSAPSVSELFKRGHSGLGVIEKQSSIAPEYVYAVKEAVWSGMADGFPEHVQAWRSALHNAGYAADSADLESWLCPDGVKSAADGSGEKGCLMLPLPLNMGQKIVRWSLRNLREDELHGKGIEFWPHITVLYGFPPETDPYALKPFAGAADWVQFRLGEVSVFECGDFDVLKINVVSPALRDLNKRLAENFGVVSEFGAYRPHVTLAYVKKGRARRFVGDRYWADSLGGNNRMVYTAPGVSSTLYLESDILRSGG